MKVAVLGMGIMGAGMARSLVRAGHQVSVWNRSSDKAAPLAGDGATVAETAAAAVLGAEAVVTMLYDVEAVLSVVEGAADAFGAETVWLQASTIGREGTQRAADLARRRSLNLLDAPVLGTKKPAEDGALVMLVSGDPALRDRVQPALEAMGSRTVWAGDELGQASALKLACNAWVASITGAVGQSVALAEGFGLDPQLFLDAIKGGATDTPYAHVKGSQMIGGAYPVSFALDGVVKDLSLIHRAATEAGVSVTLVAALLESFQAASTSGHGAEDMAAVVTAFRAAR